MTNAATRLADFLERTDIDSSNETVSSIRGEWGSEVEMDYVEASLYAAGLLLEVKRALVDLGALGRNVDNLSESFDAWTRAVFVPSQSWDQGGRPGEAIGRADLRFLRELADVIDEWGLEPPVDSTDIDLVREAITEATMVLADTSELPPEIRDYVQALLFEAAAMVSDWTQYTGGQVRKITLELSGAMHLAADKIDENAPKDDEKAAERASKLRTWGSRVAAGFVTGAASETGRKAIGAVEKVLESGLGG